MHEGDRHRDTGHWTEVLRAHAGHRVHVLINKGNTGDGLIHLSGARLFRELGLETRELYHPTPASGRVLFVYGSGAFCHASPHAMDAVRFYLEHFDELVILPSSFDTRHEKIAEFLAELPAKVTVLVREKISHAMVLEAIAEGPRVVLAEDLAFTYDYSRWAGVAGRGTLVAFRTDQERALTEKPRCSVDVSRLGDKLDPWPLLRMVSRFEEVHTDRAHVGIAAALMGRRTFFHDNSYHKNRALYEHSMAHMPHVTYLGSEPPRCEASFGSRVRMRTLQALLRVRKPFARALAWPGRRRLRRSD